jgi:hypothetical protein
MTNPADHGQGPGSQASEPYGPPPPRHPGRVSDPPKDPPPRQPAEPGPASGAPAPGTRAPESQPESQASRPERVAARRTRKGLLPSLLDADFTNLITPRVVKLGYVLGLIVITLQSLFLFLFGLFSDALWGDFGIWSLILMAASPLVWVFELLFLRIFMEGLVVRFKQAEYLEAIKDGMHGRTGS